MNYKIKNCGNHNKYVDGSYRPKFRGWFHGICLILSFIIIPLQCHSMTIILKIPIIAICFTLLCSSICHLYPFRSIYWERLVTKLDRFSIILINVCIPLKGGIKGCIRRAFKRVHMQSL